MGLGLVSVYGFFVTRFVHLTLAPDSNAPYALPDD